MVRLDELVGLRQGARDLSLLPHQAKNSLLAGERSSRLRGRGLDFEELRAYVAGDDVRSIDWRVTARARRPFVRVYREERDRPVLLVVDQRPSMFFGSQTRMKSVAAARLAALVAWSAVARGDRVGAYLFGAERDWALRPERSVARVQRLCESLVESNQALLDAVPAAPRDAAEALGAAARLAGHDALILVLSDFRDLSDSARASFERLRRHNDLVLVWVTDPLERELPDVGRVRVSDGIDERVLPAADAGFRERFGRAYRDEQATFEAYVRDAGAVGFELSTEDDVVERLRVVLGRSRA
ncbi:MAG TPA: DUF58 domain-containing protein [Polyangiaceae bacterium]|nr:DUF58 domain-containing protein [Polyangiaceae bacterium]